MRALRRMRLFAFWLLAGCTCAPTAAEQPELEVCLEECPSPAAAGVQFRCVRRGTTMERTLVVWNRGGKTLDVFAVELDPKVDNPEFAVTFPAGGCAADRFRLGPGEQCEVLVGYAPMDSGTDEHALLVRSNDPRSSEKRIPLRSSQIGPQITVQPAAIDFGLVANGEGPVAARVMNCGTEPADVTVAIEGSTEFTLERDDCTAEQTAAGTCPAVPLQPGESCGDQCGPPLEVRVRYALDRDQGGRASLVASVAEQDAPPGLARLFGPPVAACEDEDGPPLETLDMSATPSRAPGNAICRYRWRIVEGPQGSDNVGRFNTGEPLAAKLDDETTESCPAEQNTAERPCFLPDVPGVYRFELDVTDCRSTCALRGPGASCGRGDECCGFRCEGGSCAAPAEGEGVCAAEGEGCEIVSAPPGECALTVVPDESLFGSVLWDGPGDLDVHMVNCCGETPRWGPPGGRSAVFWARPSADWCEPREYNGVECMINADCEEEPFEWCTANPDCAECDEDLCGDCGIPPTLCTDATDDPFLRIDDVKGPGPEAITVDLPCAGTYAMGVHYFPGRTSARVATVRVLVLGQEVEGSPFIAPLRPDDFWYVGRLVVPQNLSERCFVPEPLVPGENPAEDVMFATLPPPCANDPATCDPTCE